MFYQSGIILILHAITDCIVFSTLLHPHMNDLFVYLYYSQLVYLVLNNRINFSWIYFFAKFHRCMLSERSVQYIKP